MKITIGEQYSDNTGAIIEIEALGPFTDTFFASELSLMGRGPSFLITAANIYNNYKLSGTRLPLGQSNEFFGITMRHVLKKCQCGLEKTGCGGEHSDWCALHPKNNSEE